MCRSATLHRPAVQRPAVQPTRPGRATTSRARPFECRVAARLIELFSRRWPASPACDFAANDIRERVVEALGGHSVRQLKCAGRHHQRAEIRAITGFVRAEQIAHGQQCTRSEPPPRLLGQVDRMQLRAAALGPP
jgi:hypothetical protein